MKEGKKWKIELTENQLQTIAEALEFTSRFHCGGIGSTYIPAQTRQLLWNRDDWEDSRKRTEQFDALGGLIGSVLHKDLSCSPGHSKGVGFSDYSDHLYDMYKMINVELKKERDKDLPEEEVTWNVNSSYTKFSNNPDIKVTPIK